MDRVPHAITIIADGRPFERVWTNELGGSTYEIADTFVKWTPATGPIDLEEERVRLAWAVRYTSVPVMLDHGRDDEGAWIVTRALPGRNAIAPRWKADPATAVRVIGAGLRAFHDALPIDACPFSWSIETRLADIRRRASAGLIHRSCWNLDHQHLDPSSAIARLERAPPVDRLVVCHGDTCAPNTIITDDGTCGGHVDLGALGVADRWADLAIATWSTRWNYGPGWEGRLLDAYGIAEDPDRTAYYRLLWDLGP